MENLVAMQRYIEAIRGNSVENEMLTELLLDSEKRASKLSRAKSVLIDQARQYKAKVDEQRKYISRLWIMFIVSEILSIAYIIWFLIIPYANLSTEVSAILESKDQQIATEQDRTADAEDRIHNVMDAWNNTSKELEQCKSH